MNASARAFPARRWLRWVALLLMVGTMSITTTACKTGVNPVSGNTRAVGYSWEEEVRLGKQADQQIQQQYGVYEDAELQRYVDRVAREVLAVSHMRREGTPEKFRNTEFEFRILDSEIINAFALPGGYVYVTRGLLAHLNNEAQLAVVLGHEIGHVAARHASQQAARQQFTQLGVLAAGVAGGLAFGGDAAQNIIGLTGQAAQLFSLKYSRGNERESDRLGVEYATLAGYDAAEGAEFFTTLKRKQTQSGQSIPSWQSTHPDPGQREDTIVQLAGEWDQRVDGPSALVEQRAFYNRVENIVLGKNPRQGYEENDVFYHPELRFQFPVPAGWQLVNQPRQVVMGQPDGRAQIGFSFSQEDTPNAAATAFIGQEGLTTLDRRSTTINGQRAERILVSAESQDGQTIRALAYFIAYDGNVYRFLGVTTSAAYDTYSPEFERTMTGFAILTDSARLNVQPTRVDIQTAASSRTFAEYVRPSALPDGMTTEDIAILNQLDLQGRVSDGQLLKLPN